MHKCWSRTANIANVCNAGIDTGHPCVQKIFSCLMPTSLMRIQCVTTFKICSLTFMWGIIRWFCFTQYYKISVSSCKQIDSLEEVYHWHLRQMVSIAREIALFGVLNIWRQLVGDLHCRKAGSCLTANVKSLYPAIDPLHKTRLNTSAWRPTDQDILGTHQKSPIGPPDSLPLDNTAGGSAQAKQVIYI